MNKSGIISNISKKSGFAAEVCEKVIAAFEELFGDALAGRFKGMKTGRAEMVAGISETSGVSAEVCEKILKAFEEAVQTALSDKLAFFKQK